MDVFRMQASRSVALHGGASALELRKACARGSQGLSVCVCVCFFCFFFFLGGGGGWGLYQNINAS